MIYFKHLNIENFGPISKKHIDFSTGVNLIKGFNASGKTQTIGTIIFSLLGKSVVNLNFNSELHSKVTLQLTDGDSIQDIISKVDYNENKKRLVQVINPEIIKFRSILKETLIDREIPSIYFDNFQVLDTITSRNISDFEERFPKLTESNSWQNIKEHSKNKNGILSEGAKYLFKLLSFYLDHQNLF